MAWTIFQVDRPMFDSLHPLGFAPFERTLQQPAQQSFCSYSAHKLTTFDSSEYRIVMNTNSHKTERSGCSALAPSSQPDFQSEHSQRARLAIDGSIRLGKYQPVRRRIMHGHRRPAPGLFHQVRSCEASPLRNQCLAVLR